MTNNISKKPDRCPRCGQAGSHKHWCSLAKPSSPEDVARRFRQSKVSALKGDNIVELGLSDTDTE